MKLKGHQLPSPQSPVKNKKLVTGVLVTWGLLLFLISPVSAQTQALETQDGLSQKVSVDFKQVDVVEALKWLAKQVGLNIAVGKEVSGKVTLFLQDVPAGGVLDLILSTNKLACRKEKDVISIMSEKEYSVLYGQSYTDPRQVESLSLEYAAPSDVQTIIEQIKSDIGKVIVDKNTGTVILIDTAQKISQMKEAINKLENSSKKRTSVINHVFTLKYARVEDMEAKILPILTPDIGKLKTDKRTNTFIITDFPHKIREIKEMLIAFDKRPQQVLVEAKIVEVTLSDRFQLGIEWEKLFADASLHSLDFKGSFPLSSTLSSKQKISIGTLDADEYTATINMLKTIGKTEIISSPRIAVLDGEEARIKVATKEAYVSQTIEQTDVTTETADAIEFLDVGIKLSVSPTVHKDGFITLKIKPEISSVSKTLTTDLGSIIPIVNTSELETKVLLRSGAIVVIGGLVKQTKKQTTDKMPVVGNIPFAGNAVKSTDEDIERKELVIFLSPKLISGEERLNK